MRLRQVALVARNLEPVVADLCAEVSLRDPAALDQGALRFALAGGVRIRPVP